MKFLFKSTESKVLKDGLVYKKGRTIQNADLRERLLKEQKGFCAYTEEHLLENTLSPEVEHFNPKLKNNDNYYNYYVVSRFANQRKMKIDREGKYTNEYFFTSLFFQNKQEFDSRIEYVNGIYKPKDQTDNEALSFINYMGFNEEIVLKKRQRTIRRLKNTIGQFSTEEKIEFLQSEEKDILSFPTAIEHEFNIDLSTIIN